MPTIVTSEAQAAARGIYIIFRKAASAAKASGTGRAAMVALFPWGPLAVETPYGTAQTFRDSFAPNGFARTGQGYLMATKFFWVDLQLVRTLGVGALASTVILQNVVPANCLTVNGLYKGLGGNAVSVVVANATNAVATSYKLTVTVTDATSGLSTQEIYDNLDATQSISSAFWTTLTAASKLIGPLVPSSATRPVNITTTLAAGTDGAALVASDYLGTPGGNDKGLALLESDGLIRAVFTDDPPSGIVTAVNAGMQAHQQLVNDGRFAVVCGLPGEAQATAITNVAVLHDPHTTYHFGHGFVTNDTATGGLDAKGKTLIPLTGPWASLMTLMTPHLSPAFKSTDFTKFMAALIGLDVGSVTTQNKVTLENVGITAWEQNDDGTFSPYTDVTTDIGGLKVFEVRMRDYIAFTWGARLSQFRNGPNDDIQQQDERTIGRDMLDELKANRVKDHIFRPCILDYGIQSIETTNSPTSLAAGDFTIGYQVRIIASQRRIFLSGEIGTGVTVTVQ